MLYEYTETPSMPFSNSGWNTLGSEASTMESKYSFASSEWQNINVDMWTQESFKLASDVYTGVTPDQALSSSYVSKNTVTIEKQVVVGGLRLAYLIQHIFGNASSAPEDIFALENEDGFLQ
jgi:hypothetical protein